jgi:FMN phosphatase YigB (HAD superfamily)
MTFNLLLDLDDTLLDSNIDMWIPVYFQKLAAYMAHIVPPDKFIKELAHGTQVMYGTSRMDRTLEQVFSENFYPALDLPQADLASAIDDFYDNVFPSLEPLTKPRPEAVALVDWAFSQGWNVAVATDPLFPRKAILHRLRWAGLAPEKYPFTLIPDFQTFHFAKFAVAYYPEFLARMGWTDGPALMVGDSIERDILPAKDAGIPSFWLATAGERPPAGIPCGTLTDLRHYLESNDLSKLKVDYSSPSALLAFLQATPAVFHTLSLSLTPEQWTKHPQPGEWTFLEVLCHLRDVDAEVNLARVETVLREENAFIPGQMTDQWAEERQYINQNGQAVLQDFFAARGRLVTKLKNMPAADWERSARHTIFGPTKLRELVSFMVDHDRLHIQQAMATINYQWISKQLKGSQK